MNSAFNVLIGNLHEGIRLVKEKPDDWEDDRDDLADQIDEEIVRIEDAMLVGSLVLPGDIVEQFDSFLISWTTWMRMMYLKILPNSIRWWENLNSNLESCSINEK